MAKYSVLIPAYNAETFLQSCVESIMQQSGYSPEWINEELEVLIADDGSQDRTLDICKELAKRFNNLTYYHKTNEGPFLTREFLLRKAKGEYILYVDADDTWEPNMIQTLQAGIEEAPLADMVIFNFHIWENGQKTPFMANEATEYCTQKDVFLMKFICTGAYNALWDKAIRRQVALCAKYPDGWKHVRHGEDRLFTYACLQCCQGVLWIPQCLYNYRVDNVSATRKFRPEWFEDVIFVESQMYEALQKCTDSIQNGALQWADSLLAKFNDYVYSAYQNLKRPDRWLRRYQSAQVLKDAVLLLKKSLSRKQRVKALLVQHKMFAVIYIGLRCKNKV